MQEDTGTCSQSPGSLVSFKLTVTYRCLKHSPVTDTIQLYVDNENYANVSATEIENCGISKTAKVRYAYD